jgi:hypothetical protein
MLALAVAGLASGASASPCNLVAADVIVDTTWGPADVCLAQPIFVKDGATLTILPGTVVRGQPRTAAVTPGVIAGTPGALVITQTGRLIADADEFNPIIFTTAAIDNDNNGIADGKGVVCATCATPWVSSLDTFLDDTPKTAPLAPLDLAGTQNLSLWGGLVLLGNAPTNLDDGCGLGLKGQCTIEGLTIPGFDPADATYGGLIAHDSSGFLDYVSVRHAGDQIGADNELNGVTLGAVGDGTIFRNIEVYVNFDDGIEWFGGTVNGTNLITVFVGDDNFDLDEGYTGVNQFMLGVMPFFNQNSGSAFGSASGDKAGEWDGDNFLDVAGVCQLADGTCRPLSNPSMFNITILGSSPDAPRDFNAVSNASANRGIQMRNGFAGEMLNSIVVNTGTAQPFDIDTGESAASCTAAGVPFACCTGAGTGPTCTGPEGCPGPAALCTAPGTPFACCTGVGTTDGTCPGYDVNDNVNRCTAQVLASTFDDGAALDPIEEQALACGNNDPRVTCNVITDPGCNICDTAADVTCFRAGFQGLVKEDQTFNPLGNASGHLDNCTVPGSMKTVAMDPRPKAGIVGVGGGVTGPDGVSTFRGAFNRTAPKLWTTNWTVLNIACLMAD